MSEFIGPSNYIGYGSIENFSELYLDFSSLLGDLQDVRTYQSIPDIANEISISVMLRLNEKMIELNECLVSTIKDKKPRETVMGLIKNVVFQSSLKAICDYEHSGRFVRTEAPREAVIDANKASNAITFEVCDELTDNNCKRPTLKDVERQLRVWYSERGSPYTLTENQLERQFTAWRKAQKIKESKKEHDDEQALDVGSVRKNNKDYVAMHTIVNK